MYTFSFIVGNIIPKRVQCIHSATKSWGLGVEVSEFRGLGFRKGTEGFYRNHKTGDPKTCRFKGSKL